MKTVRVVGGTVFLFLVVSAVYAFVLGGGGLTGATVENVSADVSLNDEISERAIEGNSRSCISVGPPPDHFSVTVRGIVDDADSGRYVSSETYDVVTRIGEETAKRETEVIDGYTTQIRNMMIIPDDESVEPGEKATVTVSLEENGNVVDTVNKTVTVEEQNLRCAEGIPAP